MRCCGMAFAPVRMRTIAAIAAAVLFGLGCGHPALAQSAPRVNVIPPPAADDPSTPGSDASDAGQSATDLAKKLQNPIGDLAASRSRTTRISATARTRARRTSSTSSR